MKKSYQHTIDFLFPIALFFVFSSTAILVLLLSANIYKGVVADSEKSFEKGTALAYITQKIRQNDDSENTEIFLSKFDNCEALAISQKYNHETYITYIYETNGELKEAFLQEDVQASANAGTTIMELGSLEMSQVSDSLLKVSCTSKSGDSMSTLIHIHSNTN